MLRRLFYWLIRLVLLMSLVTTIWACWYVYRKGFTTKWKRFVSAEFHKYGVEISFSRLTLDPVHGLVARDVVIVDSHDSTKKLAVINRIALDIDFINFARRKSFIKALDLLDARLALPLDPAVPSGPGVVLSHLNARLLLRPDEIYLSQAEAQMYGFHVSASGRLINLAAYTTAFPPDAGSGAAGMQSVARNEWMSGLTSRLNTLKFDGESPRIEIQFNGDLARPERVFIQATLWAEKVRRNRYRLDSLYAVFDYRGQLCTLKQLVASDSQGRLDAGGTLRLPGGEAELTLKSTLDLQGIAGLVQVSEPVDGLVLLQPSEIELSAKGNIHDPIKAQLSGRAALGRFSFHEVGFESMQAKFLWAGGPWYVDDFDLGHVSGRVTATAMRTRDEFRCKLQSTINPRNLMPLLPAKAVEVLSDLEFDQSPLIRLNVRGQSPDFDQCEATGELKLGRTRIRGVPLNSAAAKLLVKDKAVTYEQFKVIRDEGTATGTFTYDFGRHEVRLDQVKTSVITTDAATWFDRNLARTISPYKFKSPPNISLDGVVGLTGGNGTNLNVQVNAPGGMDYDFLKKTLSVQKISGRLLFAGDKLQISDLEARIFSGILRGNADISLKRGDPRYSAKIRAEEIDFPQLTKLFFNFDTSQGALSGNYDFAGAGNEAKTMQGQGTLNVVKGNVFAIPVFGPLSGILNGIVPGLGYNVARHAAASFVVRDGVISTDDFNVTGQGFEMAGYGKLFFLEDKIEFNIRINATGLPGVLLFPVSKLFEYTADGPILKPSWRPARLPSL